MWDLRTGKGVDVPTPASVAVVDGNYTKSIVVQDSIEYSTRFESKPSDIRSGDFFVTCMNLNSGKVMWQYKLSKEKTTLATKGPLVTAVSVFASQGDTLYEFEKTTGSLMNETRLSGQIDDFYIEQNLLYLLIHGTLYAIDLNSASS